MKWKYWAQALGSKIGTTDEEADRVARIRTMLILQAVITNLFISVNILYHWIETPEDTPTIIILTPFPIEKDSIDLKTYKLLLHEISH